MPRASYCAVAYQLRCIAEVYWCRCATWQQVGGTLQLLSRRKPLLPAYVLLLALACATLASSLLSPQHKRKTLITKVKRAHQL